MGGASLVTSELLQGLKDQLLLDRLNIQPCFRKNHWQELTARTTLLQEFRKYVERDLRSPAEKNDPFNCILQLTHISRPLVIREIGEQFGWQSEGAQPIFILIFLRKLMN